MLIRKPLEERGRPPLQKHRPKKLINSLLRSKMFRHVNDVVSFNTVINIALRCGSKNS